MSVNWQEVTAITGVISLAVTGLGWFVRISIRDEVRKLNGYYVLSAGSKLTGHEIEQRLETLEGVQSD
jgi:hypothetical protein